MWNKNLSDMHHEEIDRRRYSNRRLVVQLSPRYMPGAHGYGIDVGFMREIRPTAVE